MKLILSMLCVSALMTSAQIPAFTDVGEIKVKNASIKIEHATPCVADWNGDGKNDLLVGQFKDGKINLFLNSGTNKTPELQSPSFLKADGAEIKLTSG